MKRTSLLFTATLAMATLPVAFGQNAASPQKQDPTQVPTAQTAPQTIPESTTPQTAPVAAQSGAAQETPNTTPQQPDSPSANPGASSASSAQVFTGSIVKTGDKYLLHSAGADYQLDDQKQAKTFKGKDVKVSGQLDQSSNTIHVQSIEPASSM